MRARLIAFIFVGLAIGLTPGARAQAPLSADGDDSSTTIKSTVQRAGSRYTVYIDYDYARALAGTDNLQITVTVETIGRQNLKLIRCDECTTESAPFSEVKGPWLFDTMPPSEVSPWKLVYRFGVGIKPDIEPRAYPVHLRFEPPPPQNATEEAGDVIVNFPLYVGSRSRGRLVVLEEGTTQPLESTSGERQRIPLKLHNSFRDYDVNVQKLTVSSNLVAGIAGVSPEGEVKSSSTVVFNPPLTIKTEQTETIELDLNMAGMSSGNLISGFGDGSKVTFAFTYDDGKQRTISSYAYDRTLHLRPSLLVLLISIALGISVGVFLMMVWKLLKLEGDAKRRRMAVVSTVIIGLIVSILALSGELNISAFGQRASYDKPIMLCFLSLFATVSGTPLLKKFFGLDKPAADGADAPAAPAATTSTGSH